MSKFKYFEHDNQPARAPADAKFSGATQLLMPDGTWKDVVKGYVTEISIEMAASYAKDWIKPGVKLPADLAHVKPAAFT